VIANLLPGVRELRAPLAAGYLWLLSVWLVVEPHVPKRSKATGPLAAIYHLGDAVSAIGLGIAISFAAYLVGALSEGVWEAPLSVVMSGWSRFASAARRPLDRLLKRRRSAWLEMEGPHEARLEWEESQLTSRFESPRLSSRGSRSIVSLVKNVLRQAKRAAGWATREVPLLDVLAEADFRSHERRLQPDISWAKKPDPETNELDELFLVGVLAFQVVDELDLIESRLMTEAPALFNSADRLRAESEFRLAVIPPLVALALVLAFQDGAAWLIGVLPLVIFFQQAVRRLQRSGDRLADALLGEKVKAPVLERLEVAAKEAADKRAKSTAELTRTATE
jgi:hypothetical protein